MTFASFICRRQSGTFGSLIGASVYQVGNDDGSPSAGVLDGSMNTLFLDTGYLAKETTILLHEP